MESGNMAKSPLARSSKAIKNTRNNNNVISLQFFIPYRDRKQRGITDFDISHLLHLKADRNNCKIENRAYFIRSFCQKAKKYVENGKSAFSVTKAYESL